jgi:hypothetical protein
MKRLPLLFIIVLSVVFLTLVIPLFVFHPSLYSSEENDAFTSYHSNPAILGLYADERSADVSALMQELLSASQPIVLNIKVKDFEDAERLFREYKEKSQYFNQVVINLDLTESTIGDFQRENQKNLADLEWIINQSAQLDQVNRLEIQYRSGEDPALLYIMSYEGDAIQENLENGIKDYLNREPKILELGNQLDLDTTNYKESGEILKEIDKINQETQETRDLNRPVLNLSALSISVSPNSGYYGDTLQVVGAYPFTQLPNVTLVLDNRDWKTVMPDQNGVFRSLFTIGMNRSGDHFIYATSNNRYSNSASFRVVQGDTNLTLDTYPGKHWNEVYINGSLYSRVIPVKSAPVIILVDEFDVLTVETDQNGDYSALLPLFPGNHTIQSRFEDTSFPLNPAVSGVHIVTISSTGRILWSVLIGTGIILISILISVWYLRRSDHGITRKSGELSLPESVPVSAEILAKPSFQADVLARYQILFENSEWSGAAHLLYRSFIDRIDFPDLVTNPSTMTPRELFNILSKLFPGAPWRSFLSRYEEIRYGGVPLLQQDRLLTDWIKIISSITEEGNG